MDLQAYFSLQLAAYAEYGILLSQAEIALFDQADHSKISVSPALHEFIERSRDSLNQELELQLGTLAEAEAARDQAVVLKDQAEAAQEKEAIARAEAERSRAEAEALNAKLAEANGQLQERNDLTEAKLLHEKEMRAQQSKADFQKTFSVLLIGLIVFSLALPYIGSWAGASEKISESTNNLSLLLVQTLAAVAAFLYSNRRNDGGGDK